MNKYRNEGKSEIIVMNVGIIAPGQEFETELDVVAEGIALLGQSEDKPEAPAQLAASPAPAQSLGEEEAISG